jgi:hypothetical protein
MLPTRATSMTRRHMATIGVVMRAPACWPRAAGPRQRGAVVMLSEARESDVGVFSVGERLYSGLVSRGWVR